MATKVNLKVRVKNPWFWIGLLGVILTAMGVSPEMLTSWQAVYEALIDLVTNPYALFSVGIAVLGIFIDPTTAGVGDSTQALSYLTPKKTDEK